MNSGVINVYKPVGMTSHDVVYRIRRITGIRKVGHTGTLDPDAQGVLPICIEKGTKAADFLTATDKRYTAVMRLGITTDTQDTSGKTLTTCDPAHVTAEQVRQAASSFVGEIEQVPPMYSAIKIGGKKLYELARKGIEVQRAPRPVTIFECNVLQIEGADVTIDVCCSKGTYIRTLCHDIGQTLGCGAAMAQLTRTKSGRFCVEQSVTLDTLEQGDWRQHLIPVDALFPDPPLSLTPEQAVRVRNGNPVVIEGCVEGQTYRLYAPDGQFLCLSKQQDGLLRMVKSFY